MPTAVALAAIVAAVPVDAGNHRVTGRGYPTSGNGEAARAPLKDCTRLNGRIGYYANPWCSFEEQRRFDVWEARRLGR